MSHGQQCDCAMCTIGKKMGMIKTSHDHEHHTHQGDERVCATCGMPVDHHGVCHACAEKK